MEGTWGMYFGQDVARVHKSKVSGLKIFCKQYESFALRKKLPIYQFAGIEYQAWSLKTESTSQVWLLLVHKHPGRSRSLLAFSASEG